MQIFVDADACPVRRIIVRMAQERGVPVTMVTDTCHELDDGYSTVITVDKARDSVDIKLINLTSENDIVVTQDFGVAAMALAKNARAINQNGMVYSSDNMDRLLFERHLNQKIRKSGGRHPSARKRSKEDDDAFETAFKKLLSTAFL